MFVIGSVSEAEAPGGVVAAGMDHHGGGLHAVAAMLLWCAARVLARAARHPAGLVYRGCLACLGMLLLQASGRLPCVCPVCRRGRRRECLGCGIRGYRACAGRGCATLFATRVWARAAGSRGHGIALAPQRDAARLTGQVGPH